MKFINGDPSKFNPINNGFIFVGQDENGDYWASDSTYTDFVKISFTPMTLDDINARFQKFQESGKIVTENDIKVANASQIVINQSIDIKP